MSSVANKKEVTTPKVVIVLEGGMIQNALCNMPIDVYVIDYDTEGANKEDITKVPQDDGTTADALVHYAPSQNDVEAVRWIAEVERLIGEVQE